MRIFHFGVLLPAALQDVAERDEWMLDDRRGTGALLIESFAASIENIWGVQS
jgi:hypothetical protein